MTPRKTLRALALSSWVFCLPVSVQAQEMTEATALCSDPMTTGAEKIDLFGRQGWQPVPIDENGNLLNLATAHIMGFTNGMPDKEERYSKAAVLAQNFARMLLQGQVKVLGKGNAVLALSLMTTPEGQEHFACYFATEPTDETDAIIASYGAPEILPDIDLTVLRFDETAINATDDITYKMYSTWSRNTADPARTPLTDAYRLERIEQPKTE